MFIFFSFFGCLPTCEVRSDYCFVETSDACQCIYIARAMRASVGSSPSRSLRVVLCVWGGGGSNSLFFASDILYAPVSYTSSMRLCCVVLCCEGHCASSTFLPNLKVPTCLFVCLFACLQPTPLYVMDEIDAALDFKNVSIVANYIKERTKNAQFIIIRYRIIDLLTCCALRFYCQLCRFLVILVQSPVLYS